MQLRATKVTELAREIERQGSPSASGHEPRRALLAFRPVHSLQSFRLSDRSDGPLANFDNPRDEREPRTADVSGHLPAPWRRKNERRRLKADISIPSRNMSSQWWCSRI